MSKEFIKRVLSSIILLPLAFYFIIHGSYLLIFFTTIFFGIACYEWHMMSKNKFYKIYGFLFLIFSFYAFYEISIEFMGVFFVIIICVSTDIGGYIFGKIFKLLPYDLACRADELQKEFPGDHLPFPVLVVCDKELLFV